MLDSIYLRSDKVISFPIQNGLYLHNTKNDNFYTLEQGTSTFLWENFSGERTLKEIIEDMVSITRHCSFDEIKEDILEFVNNLINEELIEISKDYTNE